MKQMRQEYTEEVELEADPSDERGTGEESRARALPQMKYKYHQIT